MRGKYFIDTNIFVYTFDEDGGSKYKQARKLVEDALNDQCGLISWQIIQEFLNVATQKFKTPLKPEDATLYLDEVLQPLCEIFPSIALYKDAITIKQETHYSFYDSLIIAAALEADCKILYTEDLKHGQIIRHLKIVNPFLKD